MWTSWTTCLLGPGRADDGFRKEWRTVLIEAFVKKCDFALERGVIEPYSNHGIGALWPDSSPVSYGPPSSNIELLPTRGRLYPTHLICRAFGPSGLAHELGANACRLPE